MKGNLRLKIDWASLIVGSKFTVFALLYFVFEGNFPISSPLGGLYLEGLIHGGAYFRNFTVFSRTAAPRDWMIGLQSSPHQRNRHQEVASPPTNKSEILDTA